MDEALDCAVDGDARRDGDDEHHHQAGQVLDLAEPVGKTTGRRTSTQTEGQPQRDGGQRICPVVAGIVEKRHGAAQSPHGRCDPAVISSTTRLTRTARTPSRLPSRTSSTESDTSCECGTTSARSECPSRPAMPGSERDGGGRGRGGGDCEHHPWSHSPWSRCPPHVANHSHLLCHRTLERWPRCVPFRSSMTRWPSRVEACLRSPSTASLF